MKQTISINRILAVVLVFVVGCSVSDDESSGPSGNGFPAPTGKSFDAATAPHSEGDVGDNYNDSDGCSCPGLIHRTGKLFGPCRSDGNAVCDPTSDGTELNCRYVSPADSNEPGNYCLLPAGGAGDRCQYNYDCEEGVSCDFQSGTCSSGGNGGDGGGHGGAGDQPPDSGIILPDSML